MAYRSVRDVVNHPEAQQSTAFIETCAEMCRTKGVNFSEVLQDPVFRGHRALYWIIISRPPPDQYGLLSTILNHCGPLSPDATNEVRLACVQVGDQALFSHLWRHPAYGVLSRTDEMLLGGASPADHVEVKEIPTDHVQMEGLTTWQIYAFTVRFEISQFHKRMSISERIVFEFIARGLSLCQSLSGMANVNYIFLTSSGRLWYLKFYVAPDKNTSAFRRWTISLSIVNPGPPTWLHSVITILEPRRVSAGLPPRPLPNGSAMVSPFPASSPGILQETPPIEFQLQMKSHQLLSLTSTKTKLGPKKLDKLVANFAENAISSELQYPYAYFYFSSRMRCSPHGCFSFSKSAYYSQDGTLQVVLVTLLKKPSDE